MGSSSEQDVPDQVLIDLGVLIKPIDFVVVGAGPVLELGLQVVSQSLGLSLVLLQVGLSSLAAHPVQRRELVYCRYQVDPEVHVVDRGLAVLVSLEVGELSCHRG